MENMEVSIVFFKGNAISIDLPTFIEAKVVNTEPGLKGDTVSSSFKPAEIETGAKVAVPLFIENGNIIRVDTRTGDYITRVWFVSTQVLLKKEKCQKYQTEEGQGSKQ